MCYAAALNRRISLILFYLHKGSCCVIPLFVKSRWPFAPNYRPTASGTRATFRVLKGFTILQ